MSINKVQILNEVQVKQMIKRIAYQVYENHFNEKELVIGGIAGNGTAIAWLLYEELAAISKIRLHLLDIKLDKVNPSESGVTLNNELIKLTGRHVIVVDDVLNTGKTLVHALHPFIQAKTKRIQVAVLVDRNHRNFPVSADYIGMSLSTTMQEHILVNIQKKKINVYLA